MALRYSSIVAWHWDWQRVLFSYLREVANKRILESLNPFSRKPTFGWIASDIVFSFNLANHHHEAKDNNMQDVHITTILFEYGMG